MSERKAETELAFDLDVDPKPLDVAVLERGLFRFEETRLGNPQQSHFSIFMRDATGEVRGGVDAHMMWHRTFIKTMWIAERLRGQGHGTRLMQAAEAEAIRRQSRSMWLTALGHAACHFYLRLGFQIYGTHDDYINGQDLFSLRKDF